MLELRQLVKQVGIEIAEVKQPALIVHPRDDDRASLRNLHYLQCRLAGATETVVLNDSYHLVTLDRPRQIVVARTVEFATRLQQALFQKVAADDLVDLLDDYLGRTRTQCRLAPRGGRARSEWV
jgi:carboxylesterase